MQVHYRQSTLTKLTATDLNRLIASKQRRVPHLAVRISEADMMAEHLIGGWCGADPYAITDHGALVDTVGDVSHVRLLRTDGSDATLVTRPPRMPLELVSADAPGEMWHSPHRAALAANTTRMPGAQRQRARQLAAMPLTVRSGFAMARAVTRALRAAEDAVNSVHWGWLAAGALVCVATIAISAAVAPWGFALPIR